MWRIPTTLLAITALALFAPIESVGAQDAETVANVIDEHIQSRLDAEGVQRVPQADDAEFLRRVFLDLHGVVPSAERARRFLDSTDPDKRRKLVDELLASPRFGRHFADIWRQRLVSPITDVQQVQLERFTNWLADRFNANDTWDRITHDLLTATGTIDKNPAVTYLIEGRNPRGVTDLTDMTSRHFLGIRLNCAQCHDHPFTNWTRQDYWGMAAFFVQIQTPGRPKRVHVVGVQDDPQIALSTLASADMIDGFLARSPTFLGNETAHEGEIKTTHRQALARWITSRDNPYFARATVNRMWWHFFGRGIVNPVDDMHAGNSPSHPELLDDLSVRFVQSGFDLKFLCRSIVNSRTYQQTSRPGKQADLEAELFARIPIKVLTAEQLYDSLVEILGPPARGKGSSAKLGAREEFAHFFADDSDRDPTRYERGIPQLLRLMNSPEFAGKNVASLISRVATSERNPDAVMQELFLAILARRPRPEEFELFVDNQTGAVGSPRDAYADVAWVLLMSSEFSLNH